MIQQGYGTDWARNTAVADGFEAYDDLPERVLGYPTVFSRLQLSDPGVRSVLDYGCGPGKVAQRAAGRYDVDVLAADVSSRMIQIARSARPHPRVDYHLIRSGQLSWLPDETLDAAMCCYVFINIGDIDVIRLIAREVYRVLRPGAYFSICDTNPATTGVEFSTFRSGAPGMRYEAGQPRSVRLYQRHGGVLELSDYHWPREAYGDVLARAGFSSIEYATPLLGDVPPDPDLGEVSGRAEPAEAARAPFLVTTGRK